LGVPEAGILESLQRRPFLLTIATDLGEFFRHLAGSKFDAIVAPPDDAGLHAVRLLKLGHEDASIESDLQDLAVDLNRATAVFLLPLPNELEFALVIAPPSLIYFYRISEVSVATAILNLDVNAIVRAAPS
jgi:hypothetical protein